MNTGRLEKIPFALAIIISASLLGVAVTAMQVESLGLHFIRVKQEATHQDMLAGLADNPWQYRILGDWLVEPMIALFRDAGIPTPSANAFIVFRFLQVMLILCIAGYFYRRLGLPLAANLIGISVIAWGMGLSLYNSDLSLSVFFDVAFYLLAALFILDGHDWWVAALMLPAALNRETSALIPIMLAAYACGRHRTSSAPGHAYWAALAGAGIFAAVFIGVRLYFGPRPYLTADGYYPGLGLIVLNITRWVTWQQILVTMGIVPIIAALAYPRWPPALKTFGWSLIPFWLVAHFGAALVAETRLLLVPLALVIVPGALFALEPANKVQTAEP